MPRFVSKEGEWHAAKERVGLTNLSDEPFEYNGETINPGEPFVYNGPDREAVKMLWEAGQETLGTNFRADPEFLKSLQAYGLSSDEEGVKKYLKRIGYNEEEVNKVFDETASVINKHELPARHNAIVVMGGGKSTVSGDSENNLVGGFGEERARKQAEVKQQ